MDPETRQLPMPSPIGELVLVVQAGRLIEIRLPAAGAPGPVRDGPLTHDAPPTHDAVLEEARRQLDEYFVGRRVAFDLPLRAAGTVWQKEVWGALQAIPYGATVTYGDVARRLGKPAATRAVGHAAGQNPLPIVVPCHRVIGADGGLCGFGGGLEAKRRLLALERAGVTA